MTGGKRRQRGSGSAGSDGERGMSPLGKGGEPLAWRAPRDGANRAVRDIDRRSSCT